VLGQGLTLTILGMAIVFTFLAILLAVMIFMSGIIRRLENRRRGAEQTAPPPEAGTAEAAEEKVAVPKPAGGHPAPPEIAAAIGVYARAGGVLPSDRGEGREDVAAVIASVARRGGAVPRGRYREIAAAVASAVSYKNT
jgi:sodium pump decarboxylase gamma subunit